MPNPKKLRALCANDCGRRISKYNLRYCSNTCHFAYRRRIVLTAFKAERFVPRTWMHRSIRNYMIEKLGEYCQRCGWAERNVKTGRVPLEIEHLDGDWQNCTEANLTVLCPNCHSLTPTFRALNRGKGRPGRPGLIGTRGVQGEHKPVSYFIVAG